MSALVSVLIPAYNHEKYVQETIQSIIDQTYQNIELLVFDDGSPDGTWEKINQLKEKCEKRFARVVFKTQKNQGVCSTMNGLLKCANGDYTFIIASDDVAAPDAIETLHDFLSINEDYALAVGENILIDGESRICYWDKKINVVYDLKDAEYTSFTDCLIKRNERVDFYSNDFGSYSSLILGNHVPNGYLVRKSIFQKIGYYTASAPLEDYWLMLQISKYAKMKYIPKTTFYYRWHGANNVMQKERLRKLGAKTLAYEAELVKSIGNESYKNLLNDALNKYSEKQIFKIPFLFEVHKRKTFAEKETYLILFGMRFQLKKRSFL